MSDRVVQVLMICTGNICRSPLAECVLRNKAVARGVKDRLEIDSAGVGDWHCGEPPDPRIRALAAKYRIPITGNARQLTRSDFDRFDRLVCMDRTHKNHVLRMGAPLRKVSLLLDFHPDLPSHDVPDPYYGGSEGFEAVYQMIDAACDRLLDDLFPHSGQER